MEKAPVSTWWQNPAVVAAIIAGVVAIIVAIIQSCPRQKQPLSGSQPPAIQDTQHSLRDLIQRLDKIIRSIEIKEKSDMPEQDMKMLLEAKRVRKQAEEGKLDEAKKFLFSFYYNTAKHYREKQDYTKAITTYDDALKINPDHFGSYYNLGDSYRKIGDVENSIAAFQKALEITPTNPRAHYNLGNLYQQKGEDNKAKLHYKKVIELEPEGSSLSNRARKNLKDLGK